MEECIAYLEDTKTCVTREDIEAEIPIVLDYLENWDVIEITGKDYKVNEDIAISMFTRCFLLNKIEAKKRGDWEEFKKASNKDPYMFMLHLTAGCIVSAIKKQPVHASEFLKENPPFALAIVSVIDDILEKAGIKEFIFELFKELYVYSP